MITTSQWLAAASMGAFCWACGSGPRSDVEPAGQALAVPGGSTGGPEIFLLEFAQPALTRPPAGPENDVTGRVNAVRFTVTDHGGDSRYPPVVTCAGTTGSGCVCQPCGGSNFTCQHGYDVAESPPGGAALLPETLTVTATSHSHHSATATLHWFVDAQAPTVSFLSLYRSDGVTPQNSCTQGGGASAVTLPDGVLRFDASDPHGSGTSFRCTLSAVGSGFSFPVLDEAACSARISESAAGPNAYGFAFSALADGAYTLALTAGDAVGNEAAASFTWTVDGTRPVVSYVSPAAPGAAGNDIVAPDASTTGTFSTSVDPSDQPGAYQCGIDGVVQACSPAAGYLIANLSEGAHTVQITATDCVGNVYQAPAVPFDVDLNAPYVNLVGPATDLSTGDATFTVLAQDAITNIQEIQCALDGELGASTAPCFLQPAAGGSFLPTPLHVLTFAGELIVPGLSPGEHRLSYLALDHWGHASPVGLFTFAVSYAPDHPGGVIVIGQDYSSIEAGGAGSGGSVTTTPTEKILGNAVFMAKASGFDRPIHLVLMDLGSEPADLLAQSANVVDGACRRMAERKADLGQSCDCGASAFDPCLSYSLVATNPVEAPGLLADSLLGADVLVLLDQDGVGEGALAAVGSDAGWETRLRNYASMGGIVIVTSGTDAAGAPSSTFQLVRGLLPLQLRDPGSDASSRAFLECHSRDPLAYALSTLDDTNGGLFDWPESYVEPATAVRFVNEDLQALAGNDTNEVFESEGAGCVSDACPAWPVVIHKYFPARLQAGPLHVFTSEISRSGTSTVLGGRTRHDTALFQRPGDAVGDVAFCPLHGDGSISHEMAPGGIVTIARGTADEAGDPFREGLSPGLESLYGVGPGEQVLIGLSSFANPSLDAPATVTMPVYPGAHHYRVSSGCQEITAPDPGVGSTTVDLTVAFGERCSNGGADHPYFVVAAAADVNDDVLAFNTAAVEPPQGATLVPAWRGWISEPYRLVVQPSPAFDPTTDPLVGEVSIAVALGHQGLLFDEAGPPDESSLPWTPRFPSVLAAPGDGAVRLELRLGFRPDPASGSTDVTSYSVLETPPGADQVVDVAPAQFLPRVSGITPSGTPGVDGAVFWSVDALVWSGATTTLDVADADGEVVLQKVSLASTGGVTCPGTTRWLHMATPSADTRTSLTLPLIPPQALACVPSAVTGGVASFFSSSIAGKAVTHQVFADLLPDPLRVLAYGGPTVIAAPRRTAPPGTSERYTFTAQFTGGGGPPAPPPAPATGGAPDAGGSGCGAPGTAPSALLALLFAALRTKRLSRGKAK